MPFINTSISKVSFFSGNRLLATVAINVPSGYAFSKRSALVQTELTKLLPKYPSATMAIAGNERYLIEDGKSQFNGFVEQT